MPSLVEVKVGNTVGGLKEFKQVSIPSSSREAILLTGMTEVCVFVGERSETTFIYMCVPDNAFWPPDCTRTTCKHNRPCLFCSPSMHSIQLVCNIHVRTCSSSNLNPLLCNVHQYMSTISPLLSYSITPCVCGVCMSTCSTILSSCCKYVPVRVEELTLGFMALVSLDVSI